MIYGTPTIVTNGLLLYLDAANSISYVSGSTIWRDISGNINNGTLTNGPTFSSDNGGSIVLGPQLSNDYILLNNNVTVTNNFTISTIVKPTFPTLSQGAQISGDGGNRFRVLAGRGIWFAGSDQTSAVFGGIFTTSVLVSNTNPTHITVRVISNSGTSNIIIFINGIQSATSSFSYTNFFSFNTSLIGQWFNNSEGKFIGNLYTYSVYNRALSAQEVLQNFNATKTRFGL
jgi:hypothetical protein